MSTKENARMQGGRKGTTQDENEPSKAHGINNAGAHRALKPLFAEMVRYREAKLDLIPLYAWHKKDQRGRERGKSPIDSTWQRRAYSAEAVLERAQRSSLNVGFRIPADVVVLDVDPRNFPEGRDSLAEVTAALGIELSVAPHVVTGSGGHHYYFRKPADVATLDSLEDFPGIEFKSRGRQVVAAGSVHPCGGFYRWDEFSPDLADMPDLPTSALDAVRRPVRERSEREAGELTPRQLEGALECLDVEEFQDEKKWRDLAMACHHATNGEGRQEFIEWSTQDAKYMDDAWIIGNRWDSFHANAPHGEPVTARLLYKLVLEVGGQIPNSDPEDDFEPWEDDGQAEQKQTRWSFLSIDELEKLPPPRWLIPGVLTEGSLAAIYGAPESGKSFLAVDMSMAIASGIDWHGRGVERGAVLYIAAEGAPGLGKRVRAWKQDRHAQEHAFDFRLMRDEINFAAEKEGTVRAFVKAVTDELGPLKLVVIDTLNQTAAGADENSAKDMSRYIASMKWLRDATGAAVVVVHHSGKDVSKGMRGSTALLGAMDTTVEVERDKDKHSIKVAVQKQKDAEREGPMRFNLEKVADSLVLRPTVMADAVSDFGDGAMQSDGLCALACELGAAEGTLKAADLMDAAIKRLGMSKSSAQRAVADKIPEGRIDAVRASWSGSYFWLWCERVGKHSTAPKVVRVEAAS